MLRVSYSLAFGHVLLHRVVPNHFILQPLSHVCRRLPTALRSTTCTISHRSPAGSIHQHRRAPSPAYSTRCVRVADRPPHAPTPQESLRYQVFHPVLKKALSTGCFTRWQRPRLLVSSFVVPVAKQLHKALSNRCPYSVFSSIVNLYMVSNGTSDFIYRPKHTHMKHS